LQRNCPMNESARRQANKRNVILMDAVGLTAATYR
jgi:hypothetical protein